MLNILNEKFAQRFMLFVDLLITELLPFSFFDLKMDGQTFKIVL